MTEGFLCLFWSLLGPEILYFGPEILYVGHGVLISLMESFIRNDRGIFVSFLVPFLVPESYFWSWNPNFFPQEGFVIKDRAIFGYPWLFSGKNGPVHCVFTVIGARRKFFAGSTGSS